MAERKTKRPSRALRRLQRIADIADVALHCATDEHTALRVILHIATRGRRLPPAKAVRKPAGRADGGSDG